MLGSDEISDEISGKFILTFMCMWDIIASYMVRRLPAPNKEPGANPGQFADYCIKLRFIPARMLFLGIAMGRGHWEQSREGE